MLGQHRSGRLSAGTKAAHCPTARDRTDSRSSGCFSLGQPGTMSGQQMADADADCPHYVNNVWLLAPCCQKWYRCHRCHDAERETDCGLLRRHTVARLRCATCSAEQAVGKKCVECGAAFGEHSCTECQLFRQSHPQGIYHCPYCKICRIGKGLGRSHWHCHKCVSCLPNSVRSVISRAHTARPHVLMANAAFPGPPPLVLSTDRSRQAREHLSAGGPPG